MVETFIKGSRVLLIEKHGVPEGWFSGVLEKDIDGVIFVTDITKENSLDELYDYRL